MTDVDPVVFQRDLDRCEAQSQSYDAIGPAVAGAIMGASAGLGLGAIAVGVPGIVTQSTETAVSLGAGAAVGAGAGAATGAPLAIPPPPERQSVAQCLEGRGYKIIAPAAAQR